MTPGQLSALRDSIKEYARELGFDLVGIIAPQRPIHYETYERWLDDGLHGEMAYLASERSRQRRADPRRILPECRSILVLAARYPAPQLSLNPDDQALTGRVAAYAWGEDYHDVFTRRLASLAAWIEKQVSIALPHRAYTDSGPILERDLAQQAGLGWIGKNTCLIHPRKGSYLLLAEMLLGIELEPDEPFDADRCGACRRCIEACPTSCILPDRTIDSRRCISYMTIELKGAIPGELRSSLGNWVFGCDICQQVCPWNLRFAQAESSKDFAPRPDIPQPDLIRELALTNQEFHQKFRGSPVKRSKRRGYLRNVAIALGNSHNLRAIPALALALQSDPEPLVRQHAAWALGQMGSSDAIRALQTANQNELDPQVREEIGAALKQPSG